MIAAICRDDHDQPYYITLNGARKTALEKLKTVVRHPNREKQKVLSRLTVQQVKKR
jgi:hypothetical protein